MKGERERVCVCVCGKEEGGKEQKGQMDHDSDG